jgi:manganese transport protein
MVQACRWEFCDRRHIDIEVLGDQRRRRVRHDTTRLLVLSRIVLSLQLPFAMIPRLRLVGSRHLMGEFVLGRGAKIGSWGLALLILALSAALILQMLA